MTRKRLDVGALHSALDFIRAHRRMSWKSVAAETGVSASTFTRLGQGHAPDADGLCALIDWLGLPLSRFTIDAPDAIPAPAEPPKRRLKACVEAWPDAETGSHNPACCRFPKSCSATIYDPAKVPDADLEDA